jgi:hypothetical protein
MHGGAGRGGDAISDARCCSASHIVGLRDHGRVVSTIDLATLLRGTGRLSSDSTGRESAGFKVCASPGIVSIINGRTRSI